VSRYAWLRFLSILVVIAMAAACGTSSEPNSGLGKSKLPADDTVRVTRFGEIKGIEAKAGTWAWLGVPYAKPPVGNLRWKAPLDPEPWAGSRQADDFGSHCPQYGNVIYETGQDSLGSIFGDGRIVGREDCLYLNVWRPRTSEGKLPVFAFIHGGANMVGRSDVSVYDGANFAVGSNMVFVSMNYRVGTLGWFANPSLRTGNALDDSGNFGTLDIIKSLQWIKDNIEAFGGDPDNVTISGQSAGGINIFSLLASPLATGLFHKAITMSGFPSSSPMLFAEQRAISMQNQLLSQDGYTLDGDKVKDSNGDLRFDTVAAYLRSKTLEELYPPEMKGPFGIIMAPGLLGLFGMMGVYEDGYVVPKSPSECLSSGEYNLVPMLFGCTREELKFFLPSVFIEDVKLWSLTQEFDPDNPALRFDEVFSPAMWPLLAVYEPIAALGQAVFKDNGVDKAAKILSADQDVYVYEFAWNEEPEPFDFLIGAAHTMDIPFVFGNFVSNKGSYSRYAWSKANREARVELSSAMMIYYAQFARTGNPNPPGSDLPEWTPWNNDPEEPKRIIFDTGELYMSLE